MAQIVIVDDDPGLLKALSKRLKDAGYEDRAFSNPEAGWRSIQAAPPDLIILDRHMPVMSGDRIRKELLQNSRCCNIPVIFLTGKVSLREKIEGLRLGAEDYITKPFEMEEFLARVSNILHRRMVQQELAWCDKLTGFPNRGAFESHFAKLFTASRRYNRLFTLAVVDLNGFKQINDLLGHRAGDEALIEVAKTVRRCLRESDFFARYGGDEFVILFPETDEAGAKKNIERIRLAVSGLSVKRGPGNETLKISLSIGAAAYQPVFQSPQELFQLADKRMYEDKFSVHVSQRSKKKILVVEDEPDIRKALLFRLKKAGFEMLEAADGEAAIRIARAIRPDLILLDLMLPKYSGEEICKLIREDNDPFFSKTPIIMLSGKATEADQIVGRIIGANCYMSKPFSLDEITKNVLKYIAKFNQ